MDSFPNINTYLEKIISKSEKKQKKMNTKNNQSTINKTIDIKKGPNINLNINEKNYNNQPEKNSFY